jgi:hypothetical protein
MIGHSPMPDTELASIALRPDGETLLTPPLGEGGEHRVVLEGVCRFTYNGEEFDAVYRSGSAGEFTRRHDFLRWNPRPLPIESEDPVHHRYVFRVPPEWNTPGKSVGLRVNLESFVNEFLIQPSEVKRALSGQMTMTVLRTAPPVNLWPVVAGLGVPGLVAAGGLGWVVRRRMARQRYEPDILDLLDRTETKGKAALAAVGRAKGVVPLRRHISALTEGAQELATKAQRLRTARALVDASALQADLARLAARPLETADEVVAAQTRASIAEKRRSLEAVERTVRAEELCMMRLGRIEAALEAACLSMRASQAAGLDVQVEETVRLQLQSEVEAIYQVSREVEAVQVGAIQG